MTNKDQFLEVLKSVSKSVCKNENALVDIDTYKKIDREVYKICVQRGMDRTSLRKLRAASRKCAVFDVPFSTAMKFSIEELAAAQGIAKRYNPKVTKYSTPKKRMRSALSEIYFEKMFAHAEAAKKAGLL